VSTALCTLYPTIPLPRPLVAIERESGLVSEICFVFSLHHLSVQSVQAQYLLAQRCNLLVAPGDLGLRCGFALAIGTVELREVTGNALVNLRQPPLHLGLGEVPVPRADGLELAAVDRDARLPEQLKAPAQHHELTAHLTDGLAVVLAEVSYRLEVWHQAASQPNQLDVALALPLQPSARLHSIEVVVNINLQQRRRMIGRPSRRLWLDTAEPELGKVKFIDKGINPRIGLSSPK
jgi:hypothetical protein